MFGYKKLKAFIVFFFFTFEVFVIHRAWSVWEPDLDRRDFRRCLAACCVANDQMNSEKVDKRHLKFWKGENKEGLNGEMEGNPVVNVLLYDPEQDGYLLGYKKFAVVMIAQHYDITVGFSNFVPEVNEDENGHNGDVVDLARLENEMMACRAVTRLGGDDERDDEESSSDLNGATESFVQGRFNLGKGCSGSLRLWEAVSRDLTKTIKGYIGVYKGIHGPDFSELDLRVRECRIVLAGHGMGGAVAQWASVDLLNRFYAGCNPNKNVTVVTFSAPNVFDEDAAPRWDAIMGGPNAHQRFVIEGDSLLQGGEGFLRGAFTGTERKIKESIGFTGWWGGNGVDYNLLPYKRAFDEEEFYETMRGKWDALADAVGSAITYLTNAGTTVRSLTAYTGSFSGHEVAGAPKKRK